MGARNIVINSNMQIRSDGIPYARQPNITDTGVAVYFTLNGNQQCIPCDKWVGLAENVHAIGKTVEALRGLERWGAKEMVDAAFQGFKALPASAGIVTDRSWWQTLELSGPDVTYNEIQAAYRRLAKQHHPDAGGDSAEFEKIRKAYEEGMK
jgi:hypothetical protein